MGYSHSYRVLRPITDTEWLALCHALQRLFAALPDDVTVFNTALHVASNASAAPLALQQFASPYAAYRGVPVRLAFESYEPRAPEISMSQIRFNGSELIDDYPRTPAVMAHLHIRLPDDLAPGFDCGVIASQWLQVREQSQLAEVPADSTPVRPTDSLGLALPRRWRRYTLAAETCVLRRSASVGSSNWVKTQQKPYDLAVCATLILAATHAPDWLEIQSDGSVGSWGPALRWVEQVLGRERSYHLPPTLDTDDEASQSAFLAIQYLIGGFRLPGALRPTQLDDGQAEERLRLEELRTGLALLIQARFGAMSPALEGAIVGASQATLEDAFVFAGYERLDQLASRFGLAEG